jgi:hypothetical protein
MNSTKHVVGRMATLWMTGCTLKSRYGSFINEAAAYTLKIPFHGTGDLAAEGDLKTKRYGSRGHFF